jgi:hypothetical protein
VFNELHVRGQVAQRMKSKLVSLARKSCNNPNAAIMLWNGETSERAPGAKVRARQGDSCPAQPKSSTVKSTRTMSSTSTKQTSTETVSKTWIFSASTSCTALVSQTTAFQAVTVSTSFAVPTDAPAVLDIKIPSADQAGSWTAKADDPGRVEGWQVSGDGEAVSAAFDVPSFTWNSNSDAHGSLLQLDLVKGNFGPRFGLTITAKVSVLFNRYGCQADRILAPRFY